MLKSGSAWHYKKFDVEQNARDRRAYAAAEADAWSNNIDCGPGAQRHRGITELVSNALAALALDLEFTTKLTIKRLKSTLTLGGLKWRLQYRGRRKYT